MKKYLCSLHISFMNSLEYKINYLFTIFYALFPMVMQIFMWTVMFKGSDDGLVFGYTYEQLIAYAVFSSFITSFVNTGVHNELNADIRLGTLSKYLIKPVQYIPFRVFGALGAKITELVILLVLMTAVLVTGELVFDLQLSLHALAFFPLVIIMALLLNITLYLSIGMLTFWVTESGSLYATVGIVINVISGSVFPLDIFGNLVEKVSAILPFQYMVFFPLQLIMNTLSLQEIYGGMLMQAGWILCFSLLSYINWKRGLKQYVAIGG